MNKNLLTPIAAFLTILFFAMPLADVRAADTGSDADSRAQVAAITRYIQENFLPQSEAPLSTVAIQDSIDRASAFLIRMQEASGHFAYEYHPYDGSYSNDDNMVRQAGSLYALSELERHGPGSSPERVAAIERAIDYFDTLSITDSIHKKEFLCVKSGYSSRRCQIGTTSLVLIGLLNYLAAYPEKENEYHDRVESYLAFILASAKGNGGFRNEYRVGYPAEDQKDAESSYGNGEALLALVRYYLYNQRSDVKQEIDATYAHLSTSEYDVPLYLWIMAALEDMETLWPSADYRAYAKAYTDWRMNGVSYYRNSTQNYCAYFEGLTSAYQILKGKIEPTDEAALRSEINHWLERTLWLQVSSSNPYRLTALQGTLSLQKLANPAQADGGFLTGANELLQRIDYTQHCLGTYSRALRFDE